jgi:uroporphyrin-III C-methyltransferase / precorrin-2 dehydrogenase / sirohydrochlorin ferrochelatase
MRHFPILLDTCGQTIIVSGAGECAVAKLRLLLKTEAHILVFGKQPENEVEQWANEGHLTLTKREIEAEDLNKALLLYAANDDAELDQAAAKLARKAGVKTLIVDNLEESEFITPAIVDRSPVTVAIGTEGTAPVLARKIKADVEAMLPQSIGILAQIGKSFRPFVTKLPFGRPRRDFWSRYYFDIGPKALAEGKSKIPHALHSLLDEMIQKTAPEGHVHFIGAGPGDPELLTLKARKLLHDADLVIHDRLVSAEILELARREARIIEVGKTAYAPSWRQDDINDLLTQHGKTHQVVRLKSGDGGIFGRLDEEVDAIEAAGISYDIVPGITSAAAAAAALNVSLTRRGRNTGLRIITAHDAASFLEHDWHELAKEGSVAAIYMGKSAAKFMQGRLLMHGANVATPVTIVENASRSDQQIIAATLANLPARLEGVAGPCVLMLGLAPRQAHNALSKAAAQ